ncbi:MAG TPA: hypothetical protein VF092_26450 [Longimicrobium sp.]
MKKLALNVETLRVQSFAAAEMRGERAVPAADATRPHICDPLTAWC